MRIIEAGTTNNYHEVSRTDYLHFAPQTKKDFADGIIDADARQAAALENRSKAQPEVIIA